MTIDGQSLVPTTGTDNAARFAAAKRQNELLDVTGNLPELPGQSDRIPARDAIGRSFIVTGVEILDSEFKDDTKYALLTVQFADDPDTEQVVSAGGGYLVRQLQRMSVEELQSHLWTIRELTQLRNKEVQRFNGLYPLVLDYAGRLNTSVVDAVSPF